MTNGKITNGKITNGSRALLCGDVGHHLNSVTRGDGLGGKDIYVVKIELIIASGAHAQ